MKIINVIVLAGIILLSACKSKENTLEPKTATTSGISASFKAGSTACNVKISARDKFNDNGIIHNNVKLTATDGSIIEFNFIGDAPATYSLVSDSDAYYKNAAGKQYNSISGQLVISEVTDYKMAGTFSFCAKAMVSPYDSLQITEGVLLLLTPSK